MKRFLGLAVCLLSLTFSYGQYDKNNLDGKLLPYYKRQGAVVLHFSNLMFRNVGATMPPMNLNPEVTIANNLTLGPVFTFFQFRNHEFEAQNATRFTGSHLKYNQLMVGLKSSYHLNSLAQKLIKKRIPKDIMDVYVSSWLGYSFAILNRQDTDEQVIRDNKKIRGGFGVGVRSMVFEWLGFNLEAGYSSYGYGSFGMTFVLR